MVESVDTVDLKSTESDLVPVRVRLAAPSKKPLLSVRAKEVFPLFYKDEFGIIILTNHFMEMYTLIIITEYRKVDTRKLMEIYSESNYENTNYFYPEDSDKEAAVRKVEAGFLDYLKNDFFNKTDATYWVLEIDGVWVSALRTCKIQEGLYYIEALETRPDCRRKGYGAELLSSAADSLKKNGSFRLCSCVSKKNIASLRTHEKCDFQIVSEEGYDYLNGEADDRDFSLEYCYSGA